jgi:hypothetical protein
MLKKFLGFIKKGRQLHIWFLSYLIIVLVGVVLSFFLYFSSANIVRNQTEKNMHFTVDQMRLFYDEDFLSIQNSAYTILEDASISALAKNPFPDESVDIKIFILSYSPLQLNYSTIPFKLSLIILKHL